MLTINQEDMMKRKAKLVAICLAVVFVLALLMGVLVACNLDDIFNNNKSVTEILSPDTLEHIIGYIATEGTKEGQKAEAIFEACDLEDAMYDMYYDSIHRFDYQLLDMQYKSIYGNSCIFITINVKNSEVKEALAECDIYVFDSALQASEVYDDLDDDKRAEVIQDGKYLVVESEEGLFKNTIMTASAPSSFSETRMDFIKDYLKVCDVFDEMRFEVLTNFQGYDYAYRGTGESLIYYITTGSADCTQCYYYNKLEEGSTLSEEDIAEILDNCTDDSYIDTTREEGYVFGKEINKNKLYYCGANCTIDGEVISGLKIDYFCYNIYCPKELVVPAKVDKGDVIAAGLRNTKLETITLSEGILEMEDFSSNSELARLSLPKSIKLLCKECPFKYSYKFTTLEYAGTTDEWNAIVAANNLDIKEKWCKYKIVGSRTYEFIDFTVQCSDGSIYYSAAA